jgi:hypothetical protein
MKTAGQRTAKNVKSLSGGTVVLKEGTAGGMRKLRCPSCGGIAVPTRTTQGKAVTRCGSCQREFTVRSM